MKDYFLKPFGTNTPIIPPMTMPQTPTTTKWERELDLSFIWHSVVADDVNSIKAFAKVIISELKKLSPFVGEWSYIENKKSLLIQELEFYLDDNAATPEEFDHILNSLYDWGDHLFDKSHNGGKRCCLITMV